MIKEHLQREGYDAYMRLRGPVLSRQLKDRIYQAAANRDAAKMTLDESKILRAAKRLIRLGIGHAGFEVPSGATAEEIAIANAVQVKVYDLESQGYEPPTLERPAYQPDGSLLFGVDSPQVEARAMLAHHTQAIKVWEFFDGEDDQQIVGRVTSVESSKYLFLFTVTPEKEI